MFFRPLPVLTVLTLLALGLLIGLGVWQIRRMDEKAAAISAYEAASTTGPVSLEEALCGETILYGYRVASVDAQAGPEIHVYGRDADGRPGWRIFMGVAVPDCASGLSGATLLAETGFLNDDGTRSSFPGPFTLARPPESHWFDAPNQPENNEYYSFDSGAFAAQLGTVDVSGSVWLTARAPGLPAHLAQTPPSRHLGYALTWFGFAVTLLGVYMGFHVSQGRLGFTRR